MAVKQSRMLALGTSAPNFDLGDTVSGERYTLERFSAQPALLVAFLCNHCPYVQHVLEEFVSFAREYGPKGLAVVAISANDVATHSQDGPQAMARLARERGFSFPYLYDESQRTALAYQAICTPDFFLFDRGRHLVYRGQFDASRPGGKVPVTGADLRAAADAILAGKTLSTQQTPSAGCSIKWKPGNEPEWG